MGDEVRCRGNRLVTVIFTLGFDDLRHVSLTLVRVVARVRVGRIADGIARHILWISNRGALCVTIATLIINDLELARTLSRIDTGKLCRRRVTLSTRARRS